MKAYFHIGHHKTGTTSLQAFLSLNAPVLLRHGIHYPWVETQGAAMAAANAMAGRGFYVKLLRGLLRRRAGGAEAAPAILPINVREAHNALAFRMLHDRLDWRMPAYHRDLPHSRQMLIGLGHQIAQLKPRHLVFCSEVMSHFGPSAPAEIARLRDAVGTSDITLWCTLRRPDEQAASWHGQMIRFGHAPRPLSAPDGPDLKGLHFDYRRVVEPWIQAMPGCRQVLRPYDRTMEEGGSVEDFVRHSGIGFPRALLPAPVMNISLPPAVLALLREANRSLPADQARGFARQVAALARDMKLPSSRQVEMFGAANREKLFHAFRPVHDWLTRITGGQPFFRDLDQMLVCKPIPEAEALRDLLDRLAPHLDGFVEAAQRDFLAGRIAGRDGSGREGEGRPAPRRAAGAGGR